MDTLKTLMKAMIPPQSNTQIIVQGVENSWPFILAFGTIWKAISEVAKIYSSKQEAKLKALIQSEVNPTFQKLSESIDALKDSIDKLKYGK